MRERGIVAVVGLGLIGGSLALALRRYTGYRVHGCDRSVEVQAQALAAGAVDKAVTDVREAVREAAIAVFCLPVRRIPEAVAAAVPYFNPGAVVTDVGSTKGELVDSIPGLLPPGVTYVGGHPMAGSEKSGFAAACPDLFAGRPYILTRHDGLDDRALATVQALVEAIGAVPVIMDAAIHDRVVAEISHVPHILAALLVTLAGQGRHPEINMQLAAGGFRDMTRIAASSPEMWIDICLTNRREILDRIRELERLLHCVAMNLEQGDAAGLARFFTRARELRERLPACTVNRRK